MKKLLFLSLFFILPFITNAQTYTILGVGTTGYVQVNRQNYNRFFDKTYYQYTPDSTVQLYNNALGYISGKTYNYFITAGDTFKSMNALATWLDSNFEPNINIGLYQQNVSNIISDTANLYLGYAVALMPTFGIYTGVGNGTQDTFHIPISGSYTYSNCTFATGAIAGTDTLAAYGCAIQGDSIVLLQFYNKIKISTPPKSTFTINYILK